MPVATGANFKLFSKEETTEGTAPAGNWDQLPCMSFELAGGQDLTQDQVLSANQGRDAGTPFLDGVQMVKGAAKVPIDTVHFGKWLKLLLGAPSTTGTNPNYVHVFASGSDALPTRAFEKAFPKITKYYRDLGARANSLTIATNPTGAAEATFDLMALTETTPGITSLAGTPIVTSFKRFMQPTGAVLRNGAALAGITGGSITYSNNIDPAVTLRGDNRVDSMDLGQGTGGGSLTLRFSGTEGIDTDSLAATPSSVEYDLTIDANTSLAFLFPRCLFKPIGPAIRGPGAITRDYTFIAYNDGSGTPLMQVTLKTSVATY